jgi:hypothetical protein
MHEKWETSSLQAKRGNPVLKCLLHFILDHHRVDALRDGDFFMN